MAMDEGEEIVASGEALRLVQGWLSGSGGPGDGDDRVRADRMRDSAAFGAAKPPRAS